MNARHNTQGRFAKFRSLVAKVASSHRAYSRNTETALPKPGVHYYDWCFLLGCRGTNDDVSEQLGMSRIDGEYNEATIHYR